MLNYNGSFCYKWLGGIKVKHLLLSTLFIFSLFCSYSTGSAESNNDNTYIEINVNGEFIQTDVMPYIKEQHLLVPIRSL